MKLTEKQLKTRPKRPAMSQCPTPALQPRGGLVSSWTVEASGQGMSHHDRGGGNATLKRSRPEVSASDG